MSYNSTTGIITAPVSIDDVHTALGESSYDLGTLCKSSKINMWSKHKPIADNDPFVNLSNSEWWKGDLGFCGLEMHRCSTFADLVSLYDNSNNAWSYTKPTGGTLAPFRLLDFDGYCHKASTPLMNVSHASYSYTLDDKVGCTMLYQDPSSISDTELTLADLVVKDWYFGIVLYCDKAYWWATSEGTIANGYCNAKIPCSSLAVGTYKVYPFFSLKKNSIASTSSPGYLVPIHGATAKEIEIVKGGVSFAIVCGPMPTTAGSVSVKLVVKNNTSNSITFNNNAWQSRFVTSNYEDAYVQGETGGSFDNFTLAAGASMTKSLSVTISTQQVAKGNAKIIVTIKKGVYKAYGIFMTQMKDPIVIE